MHRSEHARDELVDAMRLLHKRHQGRYATFVVRAVAKVGEDEFLKGINLIL